MRRINEVNFLHFLPKGVGKYFQNLYNAATSGSKIRVECDDTEAEPPSDDYLATLAASHPEVDA